MKSFFLSASLAIALGFSTTHCFAQESASSKAPAVETGEFTELVKGAKWDEAAQWIDKALQESPDSPKLLSLSLQLANQTMRAQPEASAKRFSELIQKWCTSESLSMDAARNLSSATSMHSMMLIQKGKGTEAIDVARRSLDVVAASGDSLRSIRRDLESNLARLLTRTEQSAEALNVMRNSVESVKDGVTQGKDELKDLVRVTSLFAGMFGDENAPEVDDRNQYVERLLLQKLEADPAQLPTLSAYASFRMSQLNELAYSNPTRGVELGAELQSRLDAFATPNEENDKRLLEGIGRSLKSSLSRLEASMVRERLVGTVAPKFEAQSFVGMEETSLEALKGKVVLLDFWAVWCGPCIATFPHLRDWHDAYADKGFVILGITSDQGYVWDEAKEQAVKGTDVSHEQELEMLAAFRNHYKLRHGFVLTPKDYNKQLAVSGIPQAVLIDKQGVVRMIKVGSGEKNANDLENAIKKLLAEETKPIGSEVDAKKDTAGSSQ